MIGITLPELLRFFIQVSAAIAGASSLWGLVLSLIGLKTRSSNKEKGDRFLDLSSTLMFLFGLFFIVFLALWWLGFIFVFTPLSLAHEGIKISPIIDYVRQGFILNLSWVSLLTIVGFWGLYVWKYKNEFFRLRGYFFFFLQFIIFSAIASFSVFTGDFFSKEQIFFYLHNWHSILTLGSVVVVDVLYISTIKNDSLRRVVYPFFPWISAFIWLGLGLDFFSVVPVLREVFVVTSQFFFSQTIVAIIILNGLLLSERLNDILLEHIKPDKVLPLSPRFMRLASISGAISLTSWAAITFVDFFTLTANYPTLIALYLLVIFVLYKLEPVFIKLFEVSFGKAAPGSLLTVKN